MDNLIYSLMDEPLKVSDIKFCDSFEKSKSEIVQISKDDRFIQQVIEQAQYLPENETKNDTIGSLISGWLKKKKKLNIVQWEPNNPNYPKFMLLGTDKGILAYVEFFYHNSNEVVDDDTVGQFGICHILADLKKRVSLVDSDLDRPVFYVHVIDYNNQKGTFFETTEMIKNNIFENTQSVYESETLDLYFSKISEMGDFEELIGIFEDLKKNNVKFY